MTSDEERPEAPEEEAAPPEPTEDVDPDALKAAMATLQAAMTDPLRMAQENAELASEVKGAYLVIRALLRKLVGVGAEVTLGYAEIRAASPSERLHTSMDPNTGDLTLAVLPVVPTNRAERRRLSREKK